MSNVQLADGRRIAEMFVFHGHTATPATYIFHGGQFILAHMGGILIRGAAEAALSRITAGVAQMAGFTGHGNAVGTCIRHKKLLYKLG